MTDSTGHRPLVTFTSLAVAGAGLASASAYFELVLGLAFPAAVTAGAALLAAGLVVSLGHLGQKRRAGLAVRGAGRSALSNEALLAGLALAASAIAAGLGLGGAPSPVAAAASGVVNVAFLVSIGLVYRVRGQRTWQGLSAATPLTGGLAFGAIAVQTTAGTGDVYLGTLLFIAIDALLFSQRWRDIAGIAFSERMLADQWHIRRTQLLAARFFLLDVIPFFLLATAPTPLAIPVAAAGLLVDRFGFYALALQHTTEHEIAGVEAQIDALDRTSRD
jgi:DMSO reductase anchor subunit